MTERSGRAAASARTSGETPWAASTTVAPSGTSSSSWTKTAPLRSRSADHVRVVDDLAAHVHRGPEALDGPLDDLDGPLHPGAERPRGRPARTRRGATAPRPRLEGRPHPAQRPQCPHARRAPCRRSPSRRRSARPPAGRRPGRRPARPTPCRRPARPSATSSARSAARTMVGDRDDRAERGRAAGPAQLGRQQLGRRERRGRSRPASAARSATTTSPARRSGSRPPATPATATATGPVTAGEPSPRAARLGPHADHLHGPPTRPGLDAQRGSARGAQPRPSSRVRYRPRAESGKTIR